MAMFGSAPKERLKQDVYDALVHMKLDAEERELSPEDVHEVVEEAVRVFYEYDLEEEKSYEM